MPLSLESVFSGIIQKGLEVFLLTWWIFLPVILLLVFWEFWKVYVRLSYLRSIKWVLLRVKTPKDILKTPKAMEQIFSAIHGSYSFNINRFDKYWKGKVEDWHSFELVGDASGVYFLIRINSVFRNLLESAVYSQYPEAEIEAVDDYVDALPSVLPNSNFNLFGTEFILEKEDPYPIRTYPYFEAIAEEEKLDSIATITEAMSRLKEGERVWIQLLIRPVGNNWKKKAEELRDKLAGRKTAKPAGFSEKLLVFIIKFIEAPFRAPEWPEEKKPEKAALSSLTKGEQEVLKAIEEKSSKLGFEGGIRFVYIDNTESFSRDNIAAVMGTFRQFNTLNLNGIRPNIDTMTITRGFFRAILKGRRVYYKKRKIYDAYGLRQFPKKFSIFNIEELATLYHFPSTVVKAPMLRPVEFKKGAPPGNLPIE